MYKLLIVEDEQIEREGLRDLIDWSKLGVEVAFVAESGEEALKITKDQKVDILLTDIKMNGISGLELAKKLLVENPNIKVIITSGYQSFEYAKTAIEVDAYGYLSKPIELDELEKVFTKVINMCKTESDNKTEKEKLRQLVEHSKPLLKEKFLNNLINGITNLDTLEEDLKFYNIDFGHGSMMVIVSEIDGFTAIKEEESLENVLLTVFQVLDCINTVKADDYSETFYMNDGRYCTIYSTFCKDTKELYEKAILFAGNIQLIVNDECQLKFTIGIGKWVDSLTKLQTSYKMACDAVKFKFFMGYNQVIHYKDTYFTSDSAEKFNLEVLEDRIISAVQLCDIDTLNQCLDEMFDVMKGDIVNTNSYVRTNCIMLIARISVILHEMHISYEKVFGKEHYIWDKLLKFDTIIDIEQWMKNILGGVIDYITQNQKSNNRKVINDILKIIEESYSTNITINDISKEIYLSINYISIIFKKEIGENFSEYLMKYRLEKAKQLLKETNMKVYQVGNMVGYNNVSHFCSIFKSLNGVSPSEYRDKIQ